MQCLLPPRVQDMGRISVYGWMNRDVEQGKRQTSVLSGLVSQCCAVGQGWNDSVLCQLLDDRHADNRFTSKGAMVTNFDVDRRSVQLFLGQVLVFSIKSNYYVTVKTTTAQPPISQNFTQLRKSTCATFMA